MRGSARATVSCASDPALTHTLRTFFQPSQAGRRAVVVRAALELKPLPYAMDALEPHMSKNTLEFHYGKHHKAYLGERPAALWRLMLLCLVQICRVAAL